MYRYHPCFFNTGRIRNSKDLNKKRLAFGWQVFFQLRDKSEKRRGEKLKSWKSYTSEKIVEFFVWYLHNTNLIIVNFNNNVVKN